MRFASFPTYMQELNVCCFATKYDQVVIIMLRYIEPELSSSVFVQIKQNVVHFVLGI